MGAVIDLFSRKEKQAGVELKLFMDPTAIPAVFVVHGNALEEDLHDGAPDTVAMELPGLNKEVGGLAFTPDQARALAAHLIAAANSCEAEDLDGQG